MYWFLYTSVDGSWGIGCWRADKGISSVASCSNPAVDQERAKSVGSFGWGRGSGHFLRCQCFEFSSLLSIKKPQAWKFQKRCRKKPRFTWNMVFKRRWLMSVSREHQISSKLVQHVTHNHFIYSPFSGTTRVCQCQKKSFSGLYGVREDNRGRHTDHPYGRHSVRAN